MAWMLSIYNIYFNGSFVATCLVGWSWRIFSFYLEGVFTFVLERCLLWVAWRCVFTFVLERCLLWVAWRCVFTFFFGFERCLLWVAWRCVIYLFLIWALPALGRLKVCYLPFFDLSVACFGSLEGVLFTFYWFERCLLWVAWRCVLPFFWALPAFGRLKVCFYLFLSNAGFGSLGGVFLPFFVWALGGCKRGWITCVYFGLHLLYLVKCE